MKKLKAGFIAGILLCSMCVGCSGSKGDSSSSNERVVIEGKEKYFFDLVEGLLMNGESGYWGLSYDELNSAFDNVFSVENSYDPSYSIKVFRYDLGHVDSLFNGRVTLDEECRMEVRIDCGDSYFSDVTFKFFTSKPKYEREIVDCLEEAFAETSRGYYDYDFEEGQGTWKAKDDTLIFMQEEGYGFYLSFENGIDYSNSDNSDGVIGDNDYDGDVDENDWEEEWSNYLDDALWGY